MHGHDKFYPLPTEISEEPISSTPLFASYSFINGDSSKNNPYNPYGLMRSGFRGNGRVCCPVFYMTACGTGIKIEAEHIIKFRE
jgi:hypothetical protein